MARCSAESAICRLCSGIARFAFSEKLLGRYTVSYFRCTGCECLQTEQPYWLTEAYAGIDSNRDTGAVKRCLYNFALTLAVSRVLNVPRILDYGGGHGLLCRLLRDNNKDAYWFDRYCSPGYATGFTSSPADSFDLVTAFEVFEHLQNPGLDLDEIFSPRPRAVLVTTELYRGQGPDWWYLAPIEGQHVFFYSLAGVQRIAQRYDYNVLIGRGFFLFFREPIGAIKRFILRHLVGATVVRVLLVAALARDKSGAQSDFELLTSRLSKSRSP